MIMYEDEMFLGKLLYKISFNVKARICIKHDFENIFDARKVSNEEIISVF